MKSIPIDDKTRERVVKALQKTPMFRMLMADRLGQIVDATKLAEFDEGEPLVEQGQPSDSFLFLFEGAGTVRMERDGQAVSFGRVQPPELLGVVGLVLGEPRVTTVIAVVVFALCAACARREGAVNPPAPVNRHRAESLGSLQQRLFR